MSSRVWSAFFLYSNANGSKLKELCLLCSSSGLNSSLCMTRKVLVNHAVLKYVLMWSAKVFLKGNAAHFHKPQTGPADFSLDGALPLSISIQVSQALLKCSLICRRKKKKKNNRKSTNIISLLRLGATGAFCRHQGNMYLFIYPSSTLDSSCSRDVDMAGSVCRYGVFATCL